MLNPDLTHQAGSTLNGYLELRLRDHTLALPATQLQYGFELDVTPCTPTIGIDDSRLDGKFADIRLFYGESSSKDFTDDFDIFELDPACGYTIKYDIEQVVGDSANPSTSSLYPIELEYDEDTFTLSYEKCVAPELTRTQG